MADFDTQALTWDTEKRVKRAELIAAEIVQTIPLEKHYKALEFGCGTGLISFNLREFLGEITCVDIAKGMIDALHAKIVQYQATNLVACQLDIHQVTSLVPTYDLIFTSMALHHIVDIRATLEILYRLLKQDGYLCIVELDEEDGSFHRGEDSFAGHNGFRQTELVKILEEIGLEEVESHTFLQDIKTIHEINVDYSLFIMKGKKIQAE